MALLGLLFGKLWQGEQEVAGRSLNVTGRDGENTAQLGRTANVYSLVNQAVVLVNAQN